MKKLSLLTIIAFTLISCISGARQELLKHDPTAIRPWHIKELGEFVDSTFTDSTALSSLLSFKTIDMEGQVNSVTMEEALSLHLTCQRNGAKRLYPLFEIKHTSKVILTVYGDGLWDKIWAMVIVDKETLKVVDIEFDHKIETPGFGARIVEDPFQSQFIGTVLQLSANNYSLVQEGERLIDGRQSIDGISGATMTSKGVVNMLNEGLSPYESYLR